MFINIVYKDIPELSSIKKPIEDLSVEKSLLVNPKCPVRIMLEYIRKKCKLGIYTHFDLCNENGAIFGLFNLPTYVYATEKFEHKKTYYVIVIKQEKDKLQIFPQLNQKNPMYNNLKARVRKFIANGEVSPFSMSPGTNTSLKTIQGNKMEAKKK